MGTVRPSGPYPQRSCQLPFELQVVRVCTSERYGREPRASLGLTQSPYSEIVIVRPDRERCWGRPKSDDARDAGAGLGLTRASSGLLKTMHSKSFQSTFVVFCQCVTIGGRGPAIAHVRAGGKLCPALQMGCKIISRMQTVPEASSRIQQAPPSRSSFSRSRLRLCLNCTTALPSSPSI